MSATARQIAAIHAAAKAAGLDEESRRDVMQREAGKRSARELTSAEAGRVLDRLRLLAGGEGVDPAAIRTPAAPTAKGALRLDGPFAGKLRALWISAWNLGVVRERADTALIAFVERQTGISHVNWLRDPADARKAIEGLKKWLSREAGVVWPRDARDITALKCAVIDAQLSRLAGLGRPQPDPDLLRHDPDQVSAELGRAIRKALAEG